VKPTDPWRVCRRFSVTNQCRATKAPTIREECMHWYLHVLRNYAQFDGRSRRSEYWYFTLINLVAIIGLALIDSVIGRIMGFGLFQTVYSLAMFVPSVAVAIRRLHDTDRSGWWTLLAFVPLVGLVLIFFFAQDSDSGTNRYGQNPKLVIA
jgi:uncharacterized membrane protein YhaH (DUF805 family)